MQLRDTIWHLSLEPRLSRFTAWSFLSKLAKIDNIGIHTTTKRYNMDTRKILEQKWQNKH